MITPIHKFGHQRIGDDTLKLDIGGRGVGPILAGRSIKAQFEIDDRCLLILEGDQTKIAVYLLNADFQVIDHEVIGHWYFDALVENISVVQPDSIQLTFGTTGHIQISKVPVSRGLFKKKRYLICEGLPIEP
ncbi:MAG TPA: hypothetical protein VIF82_01490 [Burkholderiaceae bacterium]|jgi:hypothetical protein